MNAHSEPLSLVKNTRVAVVIPAYNEARLIAKTLNGIPHWVTDIVMVDDASTDLTVQVAQQVYAEWDITRSTDFYIVQHDDNMGVGQAILSGYEYAYQSGCDIAVVVGADAQMDPMEMHSLVDALLAGADYVKGDRMRHPDARQLIPKMRYLGNRILSILTGYIAGLSSLSDAQCGYTALRLKMLDKLPLDKIYPRYGFPNDFLIRLAEVGARITQIPVTPIYASEQSKLSIPKVIAPISWLLMKAYLRMIFRGRQRVEWRDLSSYHP